MSQREMNDSERTVKALCVQDTSQLKEMFHDMIDEGGLESVEKLFDAADEFLADYEEPEEHHGISDEEDARQVDDAQRAREARAINRGEF